jgi:uncharacterized protein (TIRG00374 family)
VVTALLLLLVIEYLVVPQIAGARKAADLLTHVNVLLLLAGIVLEVGSLLAYAQLTRATLPAESTPGLWTTVRIDLSTLAVSHVVPGGSAAGTGLGFRLLQNAGVTGSDAGFALAMQGIGSAVVLNALLWVALVVSIPLRGFNPLYASAALAGAVVIGFFSGAVLLLTRGEARAAQAMRAIARRVPFLDETATNRLVHRLAARLRALGADRGLLYGAVGWAAANWLLDAASLGVFLAAFGHRVDGVALLVAYGLANVLAAIPITPGGLGVIETVLTSTLVGFGVPRGTAILGVIGWRLIQFWLPIPMGGLAYLSLRLQQEVPPDRKRDELRRLAEQAVRNADDPRSWAARHGVNPPARPSDGPGRPANGAVQP